MINQNNIELSLDRIYRQESRRVFATLVRLLGDFEMVEEALHDAFVTALKQWPEQGVPDHPRVWLVSTGRFKAIDNLRRQAPLKTSLEFDYQKERIASEQAAGGEIGMLTDCFGFSGWSTPLQGWLNLLRNAVKSFRG